MRKPKKPTNGQLIKELKAADTLAAILFGMIEQASSIDDLREWVNQIKKDLAEDRGIKHIKSVLEYHGISVTEDDNDE